MGKQGFSDTDEEEDFGDSLGELELDEELDEEI